MLKELKEQIALPLTILINKSLETGHIPQELKIAKLCLSINLKRVI